MTLVVRTILAVALMLVVTASLRAQPALVGPPTVPQILPPQEEPVFLRNTLNPVESADPTVNPAQLIADASKLLPGLASGASGGVLEPLDGGVVGDGFIGPPVSPAGVAGGGEPDGGGFTVALNIMVLLTVLTLVPSVMLMTTCFVRILVVLALLRQALGTQSAPPAQVITGLALFMTMLVMGPTVDRIMGEAIGPWQRGELSGYEELWEKGEQPLRDYMFDQIEATGNWSSVYMLLKYQGVDTSDPGAMTRADVKTTTLVPAYMLSELKVGFLLGFRVYLPFLVIDMVIASILISMSMMMLPPVLISLPFKLLLFVLADGWQLVVGSLLESFVQDGMSHRLSAEQALLPLLLIPWRVVPVRPPDDTGLEEPALLASFASGGRSGAWGVRR